MNLVIAADGIMVMVEECLATPVLEESAVRSKQLELSVVTEGEFMIPEFLLIFAMSAVSKDKIPDYHPMQNPSSAIVDFCPSKPRWKTLRFYAFSICVSDKLSAHFWRADDAEVFLIGKNADITVSIIRLKIGERILSFTPSEWKNAGYNTFFILDDSDDSVVAAISFRKNIDYLVFSTALASFEFSATRSQIKFTGKCNLADDSESEEVTISTDKRSWRAKKGDFITRDMGSITELHCDKLILVEGLINSEGNRVWVKSWISRTLD
jgi:hypothetical protein